MMPARELTPIFGKLVVIDVEPYQGPDETRGKRRATWVPFAGTNPLERTPNRDVFIRLDKLAVAHVEEEKPWYTPLKDAAEAVGRAFTYYPRYYTH